MKKFLCLMLAFLLCFYVCTIAEENTGEEAVSNIITYGPVSFDTFGKWMETKGSETDAYGPTKIFAYADSPDKWFALIVMDIWNSLPEERKTAYTEQIGGREGFDSVDLAIQTMKSHVEEISGDINAIEVISFNEYSFCSAPEHLFLPFMDEMILCKRSYCGIINGYMINIYPVFPADSVYYHSFIETMNTLEIGVADIT